MRSLPLASLLVVFSACDQSTTAQRDASVDRASPSDLADAALPGDAASDVAAADAPLPACGDSSPLALGRCVEGARYQTDLEAIAQPRNPASAHWMVVQDLCASRLTSLGFTVERHAYGTGVNVVGVREGTTEPQRRVLVGAHYDHIPGCAGADDNATGVAGALEAARVLSLRRFPRTLVVACWDEEERGLIGSRAYARRARARMETIDAHFNFEMIGFVDHAPRTQRLPNGIGLLFPAAEREWNANERRGDFIAAIGNERAVDALVALERYADRIGLPFISLNVANDLVSSDFVGDLRRSDHASFWDSDYPGIMLTDTSEFRYDRYHCRTGPDAVAGLDRTFSSQVVAMTVAAAAESLGLAR